MLPFHFGVAKALMDHDVKFRTATGTSGGVMAALAILGGADIDVGIRQCFDLRLEPAAMPWSLSSFFQAYRQYFHIYRPAEYKEKMPLSELRDRLFVRLGKFNGRFFEDDESDDSIEPGRGTWLNKPWKVFQTSDFRSEHDLEEAFMSAAYAPPFTAFFAPMWRGQVALDAALVDLLQGVRSKGFSMENPSLWPPTASSTTTATSTAGDDEVLPTRVMVRTRPVDDEAEAERHDDLVTVAGTFADAADFFAPPEKMRQGFIDGYQLATRVIDTSSLPLERREELARRARDAGSICDRIVSQHAGWKEASAYQAP